MFDLKRFAFDLNLSQLELKEVFQCHQSQVSNMVNGIRRVSLERIELLRAKYGDIVDEYRTDRHPHVVKPATMSPLPASTMAAQVSDVQGAYGVNEIPAEVVEEIKAEALNEVAVPIISAEIANEAGVDIRKYIDDKACELDHINPSDLTHQADGAERIRKTSMWPTFAPGDIVFVQFLKDKRNIIDGHTYYFDMRSRPTMIRKVKIEGEHLRLIAKNPSFGDIFVTFDDILNIADIVGLFRSSFGDQYDEIEAVRRKKDDQINHLIEQNGEALRSIGDLISVIKEKK
jgi:phage repressor protein C with HTH and peptisase S24 domain